MCLGLDQTVNIDHYFSIPNSTKETTFSKSSRFQVCDEKMEIEMPAFGSLLVLRCDLLMLKVLSCLECRHIVHYTEWPYPTQHPGLLMRCLNNRYERRDLRF